MDKNYYRIAVIADDRERKSEVIQFLSEMKNVSVGIKRLSLGDYLVDNRLVFERKTLNDFAFLIIFKPTIAGIPEFFFELLIDIKDNRANRTVLHDTP